MEIAQKVVDSHPTKEPSVLEGSYDFSLVLGGPTFQLLRKALLSGRNLELLHRRVLFIALFTWAPLLLFTVLGSGSSAGRISFFHDIEVHARFLVALPVLIAAELLAHSRLRSAVCAFVDRRIVLPEDLSRFHDAINSAVRLRNSIWLELALLVLVYTVGLWVWSGRIVLDISTWYGMAGGRWELTPAGYWYVFVSIPVFQFI